MGAFRGLMSQVQGGGVSGGGMQATPVEHMEHGYPEVEADVNDLRGMIDEINKRAAATGNMNIYDMTMKKHLEHTLAQRQANMQNALAQHVQDEAWKGSVDAASRESRGSEAANRLGAYGRNPARGGF